MSMRFSSEKFTRLWKSLPEKTRKRIQLKAEWEHMSLSAVMYEWWPKLWKQIEVKEPKEVVHGR